MSSFDTLISQHPVGSQLDVDGFPAPPGNPYQCFDVPEAYIRILKNDPKAYFFAPSGYAKDFYNEYPNSVLLQSLFDRLPFDAKGQRGDIAVWGNSKATPDTHVAILESDNGTTQLVYGQNQPEAHITEKNITSNGLLGYLRPKSWQANNSGSSAGGKDMTPNFIKGVYVAVTGVEPPQSDIDFHMKNSNPESFINGFLNSGNLKWKAQDKVIADLKAQLEVKPTNSDADKKLQAIKDALGVK